MRSTVLLPLPLGPRRTKSSPSPISSDRFATTVWPPKPLPRCSRTIDTRRSLRACGDVVSRRAVPALEPRSEVFFPELSRRALAHFAEGRLGAAQLDAADLARD